MSVMYHVLRTRWFISGTVGENKTPWLQSRAFDYGVRRPPFQATSISGEESRVSSLLECVDVGIDIDIDICSHVYESRVI